LRYGWSRRRHSRQFRNRMGRAKLLVRPGIPHGGPDASALRGPGILAAARPLLPQGGAMKLPIALAILNVALILAPLLIALPPVNQTPQMLAAARAAQALA